MSEDDGTDSVDPVDEFVPIDVDEPGTFGVVSVNRADTFGKSASESASELGVTGYDLPGSFVNTDGFFNAFILVVSHAGSPCIVI